MDASSSLTVRIKAHARALGFDLVGIAPARPPEHWTFFLDWVAQGFAGEMGYLERNLERRGDPAQVLPGVRSILCVGMNYNTGEEGTGSGLKGRIARYARGDDYHEVLKDRLFRLLDFIRAEGGPEVEGRVYVDTGPVLEREVAARAGVGWFGKHTGLIHKRAGSWLLLGEILLTAELDYDTPALDHCGTCTRCIDACPTGAILEPYVLDSRKCISYLTIEVKGAIPVEMRAQMGDWVFGCDVCQEVCPWNRKAPATEEGAFTAREGLEAPDLVELLKMDQATFGVRFKGSPIKRTKRRGLLRNAAVAMGNSGDRRAVPALVEALSDGEPLVRGHAAWALGRLGGEEARGALEAALSREGDAEARGEIERALEAMVDRRRIKMAKTSLDKDILEEINKLGIEDQHRVLTFVRSLAGPTLKGISGKELLQFSGFIDKKDLQEMEEAIEKGCEQVNLDEW